MEAFGKGEKKIKPLYSIWGYMGLCRDNRYNGKENGSYSGLGLRACVF